MRNVTYKKVITNASAAAEEITNRAKKKNRLYAWTFIVLAILVTLYVIYALSITSYDGFMVSNNVSMRPAQSIVVVEYNVKPGDRVQEGDTLFSYMNVDWIDNAANPYYQSQSASRLDQATIRRDRLRSEYLKQKLTLDSLAKVLKLANKDVYLGVATKEYAQGLEWDLFKANKEYENTARLIAIENREIANASKSNGRVRGKIEQIAAYSHSERVNNNGVFGSSYSYRTAYVDMVVVDLHARHGVLVMEGEQIMTYMPYNNPEMLDLHAKMLLNPAQFSEVEDNMIFNVYAGRDYLGKVMTTYRSTYINDHVKGGADIYEYDFKQQNIVVRAEFLDKNCVYAKYQVDKYPLRLRRYKFGFINRIIEKNNARRRRRADKEQNVQITD